MPKCERMQQPVITVAAAKGGVGKTTIAIQLAACLGAVLVDLDHEQGGASGQLLTEPARRGSVVDALELGPEDAPRPRRGPSRPDLVPASAELATAHVDRELVAECLRAWAAEWGRPVVADTAPGYSAAAAGAMIAASAIVVPVVLEPAALRGLAGMLSEWGGYPLILAPTMVPNRPPRALIAQLERIADGHYVAEPISEHRVLRRRLRRGAVVMTPDPGRAVARAAGEFRRLSEEVTRWLSRQAVKV